MRRTIITLHSLLHQNTLEHKTPFLDEQRKKNESLDRIRRQEEDRRRWECDTALQKTTFSAWAEQ